MNEHIQSGYTAITLYLYAKPDLADFLKNTFGAEVTHTPTPDAEGQFRAEAKIGDAHVLVGNRFFSDPSMAAASYIYVPDVDATYKRAVKLGGQADKETCRYDSSIASEALRIPPVTLGRLRQIRNGRSPKSRR